MTTCVVHDDRPQASRRLELLVRTVADVESVVVARDADDLLARVAAGPGVMVVVGLADQEPTGVETVRRVLAAAPDTAVLVAGPAEVGGSAQDALAVGAAGFLRWDAPRALTRTLVRTVGATASGDDLLPRVVPPVAAPAVAAPRASPEARAATSSGRTSGSWAGSSGASSGASAGTSSAPVGTVGTVVGSAADEPPGRLRDVGVDLPTQRRLDLSVREVQVLIGVSRGLTNADIGRRIYVSDHTVKTHLARLFRKLGAADRAQAVSHAWRLGLFV